MTNAWEDYLYWQKIDKKTLKKVNELIKECIRTPFEGTGNPRRYGPSLLRQRDGPPRPSRRADHPRLHDRGARPLQGPAR